jgi:HSP20 family protein
MANLTRWDPFSDLGTLQDRVNQLFNQNFGAMPWTGRGDSRQQLMSANFIPPVDILEDDQNIVVQAELPGVTENDVEIRLENNVLTISGERRLEHEDRKQNVHRIERGYGRFTRSFTLPAVVDPEKVQANFDNGLLTITVPRREEAKPRQIKITKGKQSQMTTRTGKDVAA